MKRFFTLKHIVLVAFICLLSTEVWGQDSIYFGIKYADANQLSKTDFVLRPRQVMGVLPAKIDNIEPNFPPIGSQGYIGSCASWASAYGVMSYVQKKKGNYSYYKNGILDETKVFSPLFVFNQVKDQSKRCDSSGSYILDNLELMKTIGVCKKNTFDPKPYTYLVCGRDPKANPNAIAEAKNFKLDNYAWFISAEGNYSSGYKLQRFKEFLSSGYPIIFGADIDYTFWRYGGQRVGNSIIWKQFDGNFVGSHAMVCIGYSDSLQAVRVFNSWGNWGNGGFGWISYSLLDSRVFEAYIVNRKNLPALNTISALLQPTLAQLSSTKNQLINNIDTAFFIKNRFLPYNNIRLMPIEVSPSENSATIKIFKNVKDNVEQVDVFIIKKDETYEFVVDNVQYRFKVTDIKPYRVFSKPAVFFTLITHNL